MRLEHLSRLRAMTDYLTNGRMHENPWGLNREDLNAIFAATCEPNPKLIEALEAVLMFHSGEQWDSDRRLQWNNLTECADATTKGLCDFIRRRLAASDKSAS